MSISVNQGPVIALHKPQIPPNTGNISRLCVAINSPLVILGKPGFSLDESAARRAGLDHWQHLELHHLPRLKDYLATYGQRRTICITKSATTHIFDFQFKANDILLFGNETHGLPPALINIFDCAVAIPMWGKVRSLNLSNSVAICAYEFIRKTVSIHYEPENYRRTWYKKTTYRPH